VRRDLQHYLTQPDEMHGDDVVDFGHSSQIDFDAVRTLCHALTSDGLREDTATFASLLRESNDEREHEPGGVP